MTNAMDTTWTAAASAELKTIYETGKSYSLIARHLNEMFGLSLSRSACIGRARRMQLEARPQIKGAERTAKGLRLPPHPLHGRRASTPRPSRIWVDIAAPEGEGISMDQLLPFTRGAPTSCRYPLGESEMRGQMYCGEATHRGSWCAYHCEVVFKGGQYVAPEPKPAATNGSPR